MKTSSFLGGLLTSLVITAAATSARAGEPQPVGPAPALAPPGLTPVMPPPGLAPALAPPGWAPMAPPGWAPAPPPPGWEQWQRVPGSWGPSGYYQPILPPPPPPVKSWYGWQILIPGILSDALVFTAPFIGGSTAALTLLGSGLAGHALSGPIVHLAHGHPLRALASFGLEAGLPAAMFGTAFAIPCHDDDCAGVYLTVLIGVPITMVAGLAIDSAVLAYDMKEPEGYGGVASSLSLAPLMVRPLREGSAHGPTAVAGATLVGKF